MHALKRQLNFFSRPSCKIKIYRYRSHQLWKLDLHVSPSNARTYTSMKSPKRAGSWDIHEANNVLGHKNLLKKHSRRILTTSVLTKSLYTILLLWKGVLINLYRRDSTRVCIAEESTDLHAKTRAYNLHKSLQSRRLLYLRKEYHSLRSNRDSALGWEKLKKKSNTICTLACTASRWSLLQQQPVLEFSSIKFCVRWCTLQNLLVLLLIR